MDPIRANNSVKLFTLQEAAKQLAVSIDTLLTWNEHNILKPTITLEGSIGYSEEQLQHFMQIRSATLLAQTHTAVQTPEVLAQEPFQKNPFLTTTAPMNNVPKQKTSSSFPKLHYASPLFMSAVILVFAVIAFTLATHQSRLKSFISYYEQTYQKTSDTQASAQTSMLEITSPIASTLPE